VVLLAYDLVSGRAIIPVEILAAARYLAAAEKSLGISWDGLYVWWPTDEELQNLNFRRQLADATIVRDFFRDPRSLYPVSNFANPDVLPKREKAFVAIFDDLVEAITDIRTEWSQRSQELVWQKRSEHSRWIDDQLFEPLIETAIDCEDLRIGALRMQQAHVTRILNRMMPDIYAVLNESAAASNREFLPGSTYKQIQWLVDEMIRLIKAETHVKKQGGRGSGWWPRGRG